MNDPQLSKAFHESIGKQGVQGKIVSIEHVKELETEIMTRWTQTYMTPIWHLLISPVSKS